MEELLTEKEAAALLRVEPSTLQQWRYRGEGPQFTRAGRLIRYTPSALREYMEDRTVSSTSDKGPATKRPDRKVRATSTKS